MCSIRNRSIALSGSPSPPSLSWEGSPSRSTLFSARKNPSAHDYHSGDHPGDRGRFDGIPAYIFHGSYEVHQSAHRRNSLAFFGYVRDRHSTRGHIGGGSRLLS